MIRSYKELNVWQIADDLAYMVFNFSKNFPKEYLYDLTNQLRRAALSVPTNIAEGCASSHDKEFIQFLNISRRSLSETQYLLHFAKRQNLLDEKDFCELEAMSERVFKMTNALISSIRSRTDKEH